MHTRFCSTLNRAEHSDSLESDGKLVNIVPGLCRTAKYFEHDIERSGCTLDKKVLDH
jgi:hypothetical protein